MAKDDLDTCLNNAINELFAHDLRGKGLNLDRNPWKKKALIDFLKCLPEMLEKKMTKENLWQASVKAGMIDEGTKLFPMFDSLMATCKYRGSTLKKVGVALTTKFHVKEQFQHLVQRQLEMDKTTCPDIHAVGIPRGQCLCS